MATNPTIDCRPGKAAIRDAVPAARRARSAADEGGWAALNEWGLVAVATNVTVMAGVKVIGHELVEP
ncbi:hypothetical protein, partial [Plantactinospora endophytica]|uniref:hypothetical protein n=1 Tax=Plantactinospora endophytica TaxID=673535 RepID=UPI001943165C